MFVSLLCVVVVVMVVRGGLTVAGDGGRHVQTDMGDTGARLMGRKEAPTTIQESVEGICVRVSLFRGRGRRRVMLMSCAGR